MNKHPIPSVRVIIQNSKGDVLLLKRKNASYCNNQWCLPGGKIDLDQTIHDACITEVKEETSLKVSSLKFLMYQDNLDMQPDPGHFVNLYFFANFTGSVKLNEESSQANWVNLATIEKYKIAFSNKEAIIRFFSLENQKA